MLLITRLTNKSIYTARPFYYYLIIIGSRHCHKIRYKVNLICGCNKMKQNNKTKYSFLGYNWSDKH